MSRTERRNLTLAHAGGPSDNCDNPLVVVWDRDGYSRCQGKHCRICGKDQQYAEKKGQRRRAHIELGRIDTGLGCNDVGYDPDQDCPHGFPREGLLYKGEWICECWDDPGEHPAS
jgi:hypothetical protein